MQVGLKLSLFCILSLSFQSFAKEFKPKEGLAKDCSVKEVKLTEGKKIQLTCKGFNFELKQDILDNYFNWWQNVKTQRDDYILLVVSKGAHGERAIIFSKNKKKLIDNFTSSWPVELIKVKKGYKLKYTNSSDEQGNFKDLFYEFK